MTKPRTRPRVGDIVEIRTNAGTAWAQYTHQHPTFGAVLRVFKPDSRQYDDLDRLARSPVQFTALFPLGAACRQGIARILGPALLPPDATKFPLFRAGTPDPRTGQVGENWWLWDGEREWRIGALGPEHRNLPVRELINDTLLVERATTGWTPEQV